MSLTAVRPTQTETSKTSMFDTYLNHDEPYLPPTTLFRRGEMRYSDDVKYANKTNQQFRDFLYRCLLRHLTGDWGDICGVDKAANKALISKCDGCLKYMDGEVVSYFNFPADESMSLYIVTEAHPNSRTTTTVSMVREY